MRARNERYTKWNHGDNLIKLEAWARDGLTDENIAHNIGIARGTLIEWKRKHNDIADALSRGRIVSDIIVENAIYKRACGYRYKEITRHKRKDKDGKTVEEVREVEKECPPDVEAAKYWLNNRKSDVWRARPESDLDFTL